MSVPKLNKINYRDAVRLYRDRYAPKGATYEQVRRSRSFKLYYQTQTRNYNLFRYDFDFAHDNERKRYEYYLRTYAYTHGLSYSEAKKSRDFQQLWNDAKSIKERIKKDEQTLGDQYRLNTIYHEIGFDGDANAYVQRLVTAI